MRFRSGLEFVIANGSEQLIYCSYVADNTMVTEREGGGGVNVGTIGGQGHGRVKYEHKRNHGDGYTKILPGETSEFDPSKKPIYMTIVSEAYEVVCISKEINKSRNYIVSQNFNLYRAAKGEIWIDDKGRDRTNRSSPSARVERTVSPQIMFDEIRRNHGHANDQNPHSSIDVSISNGSPNAVLCRVSKDKSKNRDGSTASCFEDGHTTIGSMSWLRFSPSGNPVYITVITDSGIEICVNYEISKSSHYIISEHHRMKLAKKGSLWTDINGTDHGRSYRIDKPNTDAEPGDLPIAFDTRVVIANGAEDTVHCKFGTKFNTKISLTDVNGSGFDNSNKYSGYIALRSGGDIYFPARESYSMTIKSESNMLLYQNVAINNGGSFIISKGENLQRATHMKLWIDEFGKDHEIGKIEDNE